MIGKIYFISGWGTSYDYWKKIVSLLNLSSYEYEIIMWSDILDNESIDSIVLEQNSIIIGWSIGGLQALRIAYNNLNNILSIILISSTSNMCESKLYRGAELKSIEKIKEGIISNRESMLDYFTKICFMPNRNKDSIKEFLTAIKTISSEKLVEGLDYLINSNYHRYLDNINFPVLLLHGSSDNIIPISSSKFIENELQNSKLEIIDGYGHSLISLCPDVVRDKIERFINEYCN